MAAINCGRDAPHIYEVFLGTRFIARNMHVNLVPRSLTGFY
jgi:hypothetical protein